MGEGAAVIFTLAKHWADVIHALAIIESKENPAAIGDGGRAFGLAQQHPAFFAENYGLSHEFPSDVGHTWSQAQIVAAASFFEVWEHFGLDILVMAYNQGLTAVTKNGVRAPEYLARFSAAYQLVRSGNHKCALAA